jgi:hypothetical protein
MQRKCSDLKLDGNVVWLPFQDDIRQIECATDVVALPSDEEALGLCILEAMSLEIPVVVSSSGGLPELIEDGVSGLTMKAGNAASLAEALLRLGGSADLRASLVRNARRRVKQYFTLRKHADQVKAVLHRMTSARGRSHPRRRAAPRLLPLILSAGIAEAVVATSTSNTTARANIGHPTVRHRTRCFPEAVSGEPRRYRQ